MFRLLLLIYLQDNLSFVDGGYLVVNVQDVILYLDCSVATKFGVLWRDKPSATTCVLTRIFRFAQDDIYS